MIARILPWLALAAAVGFAVWMATSAYESHRAGLVADGDKAGYGRCTSEWADANVQQAAATVKAVAAARAEEQQAARAAVEGERHARTRAELQARREAAAAADARAGAVSVRDQLAALDAAAAAAGTPDAAACPSRLANERAAATRARTVFGACVSAYSVLAEGAGRDRADLHLRLDTALSWIHATAGAKEPAP